MPTRVLGLTAALFLAAAAQVIRLESPRADAVTTRAYAQPSPTPRPWPNLNKVKNPDGIRCSLEGKSGGVPEKAALNRLMNRYHLPEQPFEKLTLEDLQLSLPQGETTSELMIINSPTSCDPNNQRAVTVLGYVTDIFILGCGAADLTLSVVPRLKRKGVEAANCYVNDERLCTAQIFVTPDPSLPRNGGRNLYVFEVTRRSRFLVGKGLLTSNIGNNWSTKVLREKIRNRWVRFSGWLFFDVNYRERAWVSDPENKIGKPNDRQTAWEIHPVMGIEVDVPSLQQQEPLPDLQNY